MEFRRLLTKEQFHELCHDGHKEGPVTLSEFCDGCEKFQCELFGHSPISQLREHKNRMEKAIVKALSVKSNLALPDDVLRELEKSLPSPSPGTETPEPITPDTGKIEKLRELLESAIEDFKKLGFSLNSNAHNSLAEIYQQELDKL